jgi:hypothetical protein
LYLCGGGEREEKEEEEEEEIELFLCLTNRALPHEGILLS